MAEALKKETENRSEGASAPAGKKSSDIMNLLALVFVIVNLFAVASLGYYLQKMWIQMQAIERDLVEVQNQKAHAGEQKATLGKELQPKNLGTMYPIDSFLVNIASDQGPKFLQAQMEFELADPATEDEVNRKKAAIRDAIIVLLSSRPYKELREPAGMKKLRKDIVASVNNLLATGKVREVYFTQFHFN